jgi:hypothetical protein
MWGVLFLLIYTNFKALISNLLSLIQQWEVYIVSTVASSSAADTECFMQHPITIYEGGLYI